MKSSNFVYLVATVFALAITVVSADVPPLPGFKFDENLQQEENAVDQQIAQLQAEKVEMDEILLDQKKDEDLQAQIADLEAQAEAVEAEEAKDEEQLNEQEGETAVEEEPAEEDPAEEEPAEEGPAEEEPAEEVPAEEEPVEEGPAEEEPSQEEPQAEKPSPEGEQPANDEAGDPSLNSDAEGPIEEGGGKSAETHDTARNVFGKPLQKCSSEGMAITGFLDTGYCVDVEGYDHNHHIICVALHETEAPGYLYGSYDFCEVIGDTKPVNWCDSDLPCHHDENEMCPVEDWCVGENDLAKFINMATGCDKLGTINCEATNEDVITHLEGIVNREEDDNMKYEIALACIKEACGESIHR